MLVWAAVLIAVSSAFAPRLHQHRGGPTTRLRSSSDDWTEHFAESEGRPYWHNARTGETTWAAPPARDAAADAWTEHYAESEGRPYWHNTRTGETTWAAPASPAPASAAPAASPAATTPRRAWSRVRDSVSSATTPLSEVRARSVKCVWGKDDARPDEAELRAAFEGAGAAVTALAITAVKVRDRTAPAFFVAARLPRLRPA